MLSSVAGRLSSLVLRNKPGVECHPAAFAKQPLWTRLWLGFGVSGGQGACSRAACALDEIWASSAFLDLRISQMWENALDFSKLKPDSPADQSSYFTKGQGGQNLMDCPPLAANSGGGRLHRTRWTSPLGAHCREEEVGQDGTWGGGGRGRATEDRTGFLHRKRQKVFSIATSPTTSWLITRAKHRIGRHWGLRCIHLP